MCAGRSEGGEGTAAPAAASPSTSPAAAGAAAAAAAQPTLPEEQQKTGEEDENVLYASEGTLFQFDDQDTKTWRERGRGELRVNKGHNGGCTQTCC